jgi:hypothetical protein
MVLEADERPIRRIDEEIPDEAFLAGARGHVENAESRDRRTDVRHILVAEQLVAAAD